MVHVKNLSKNMNTFRLNEITFDLPAGFIMGLVGRNGAGKTTLLKCLSGYYLSFDGMAVVNNADIKGQTVAAKQNIGFVMQEDLFSLNSRLIENAKYYGSYYEQFDLQQFLLYSERFGLVESKKLKDCSKGEKLKFQFAFALAHNPKLMILDEPTGNFDPEFKAEFLKILSQFVSHGERSVILATHQLEDLEQIADYILFLDKGKQIFYGERERIIDAFRLLIGETYKINNIPRKLLVGMEKGSFGTRALVRHSNYSCYDGELTVQKPSLEDIMYFLTREDK